jgi:hypothetical protein
MMTNIKTNKMITYKRGKVEIKGNSKSARWLMFIDMIGSKVYWIAGIAATAIIEEKSDWIARLLQWLSGVP